MVNKLQHPSLFPSGGIAIADAIIDILAKEPALKAIQIAFRLKTRFGYTTVVRRDVNSKLYGELRNQVKQIPGYKWIIVIQRPATNRVRPTSGEKQISMVMQNPPKEEQTLWGFIKLIFS